MSRGKNLRVGGSSFPALQPQPLARQKKVAVLTAALRLAALELATHRVALEVAVLRGQKVQEAQRRPR